MLERLVTSKARVAILRLFFSGKGVSCHLREAARRSKTNPNQARRELQNLVQAGILKMSKVGNLSVYSADADGLFFDELSSIVGKSLDIEGELRKVLSDIDGIRYAFIFGSFARGDAHAKSDVDVLIIGRPDDRDVNDAITGLERRLGREIQYIIYPQKEFQGKRGHGFLKNVWQGKKIPIVGDLDELERS